MNIEKSRRYYQQLVHIYKVTRHFIFKVYDKELTYYAASLSWNTIFSIIPILLITLSIFTNLPSFSEHYANIKAFIFENLMPTHQEIIAENIDKFLQKSVQLGFVGFIFALIGAMMFFQNYEYIVNKIFGTKPRRLWNSVTTYWTLVTLMPIALALSFYLSGLLQNRLNEYGFGWLNLLSVFPYFIIWMLFFATYSISANTDIKVSASLAASFVSSLVWYFGKSLFIYYVSSNMTYENIYGSFSILLFFFLWIYISWVIFLYGLKLCSLINHEEEKTQEQHTEQIEEAPVARGENQ